MVKIISWNINGARGKSMDLLNPDKTFNSESNLGKLIATEKPDIVCFNETKCQELHTKLFDVLPFKYQTWNCSTIKKGYSGVAIVSNMEFKVLGSIPTLPNDDEGRSLVVEFGSFILTHVYTPNSGTKMDYRQNIWNQAIYQYFKIGLDMEKPIIYCGDLNVVHTEMDIYNPKYLKEGKMAGTLPFERNDLTQLLELGYLDIWRHLHPNDKQWTWWNPRVKARQRDIGWRIDYFLIRQKDLDIVVDSTIHNNIMGSDHCPISLVINI